MDEIYQNWLRHLFDHEVADHPWFFELDPPDFPAEPTLIVELIARTMRRSGTDLTAYSDDQVGQGLYYLFSNSASEFTFAFFDPSVRLEDKLEALRSIAVLYERCFEPRCRPALGHLSEPEASLPLNYICYMLWDITPLIYWERRAHAKEAYDVLLEVLESALGCSNIACVESAIHGLGHVPSDSLRHRAEKILRACESSLPDERLVPYARAAATGCIL